MLFSPVLAVHISAGILGILSGAAAMSFRKGSPRHALAGKVFVAAMLTMAAAAVYLAFVKQETPNIVAGFLTFYLVTTAWLTARRRDGETSRVDLGVLLIPLIGGSWLWFIGLEKAFSRTPSRDGVPVGMSFFIGSVMLLAAAGDIRILVRHLWRMCFGLFIATGSFFLGQQQVFPAFLRGSVLLIILGILPLILLFFWLFRVWFTNKGRTFHSQSLPYARVGPDQP